MQNEHIEKDEHEENEISLTRIITAGILLVAAEILEHIKLSDFIKNFYLIDTYQQYILQAFVLPHTFWSATES